MRRKHYGVSVAMSGTELGGQIDAYQSLRCEMTSTLVGPSEWCEVHAVRLLAHHLIHRPQTRCLTDLVAQFYALIVQDAIAHPWSGGYLADLTWAWNCQALNRFEKSDKKNY